MKQKRTFIAVLLIIAVLALGIAYAAALTSELKLTGSVAAAVGSENFKVQFTNFEAVTSGETFFKNVTAEDNLTPSVTGSVTADTNGLEATFDVSQLSSAGDKITARYTIVNNSNGLNATLTNPQVTNTNAKISVNASLDKNSLTTAEDGKTAVLTVTFTLNETVMEPISEEGIVVKVPVTAVTPAA